MANTPVGESHETRFCPVNHGVFCAAVNSGTAAGTAISENRDFLTLAARLILRCETPEQQQAVLTALRKIVVG